MHLHNAIEALNHDYELIFLCILLDKKAISVFFVIKNAVNANDVCILKHGLLVM